MIKVGIIGGSGYTAGELIRILMYHSKVTIDFVFSTTNAGKSIASIHQDVLGDLELDFTDTINPEVDVVFLCLGHGKSKFFLTENEFGIATRIIDLSNDFRLKSDAIFGEREFVYGLPELNKCAIEKAQYIANPGCFATAIQLALLPLASEQWLTESVHINAVTGSTGAGVQAVATTHHSWRANNISHYKAFEHQHLGEINESILQLQSGYSKELFFIPNRGDFTRGIFATLYTEMNQPFETIVTQFKKFYQNHPFVTVTTTSIDLKQVVQTNKCIISLVKRGNHLLVTSIIDNLIKGASGQAIQNMNLMFRLYEKEGLQLKPSGF